MREVVHGLIDGHLLELGLFCGQGFRSGLVRPIRGQPKLVAKRGWVIVDGNIVEGAFALSKVAVLFVVADADHDAQDTHARAHIGAQGAEGSVGSILVDVEDSVLDVIGCGHRVHFEFRFRTLQLRAHRGKNHVVHDAFLLCGQRTREHQ